MNGNIMQRSGAHIMSPCRRIERVMTERREAVILLRASPVTGETEEALSLLSSHSARAVFEIFGSTAGNRRGRGFYHIPAPGRDGEAGVEACPELLKMIRSAGHGLTGAGWSYTPAGRACRLKKKPLPSARAVYDDAVRLRDAVGGLEYMTAVGGAENTADEYSFFDICEALEAQYLCPAREYFQDNAQELQRFSATLKKHPEAASGSVIAVSGTKTLAALLEILDANGYAAVTASQLTEKAPMADMMEGDEPFEAASEMLSRGYTVLSRSNEFRPGESLTKAELYAMVTPRHLMHDYMTSRLLRSDPKYEINRQSEKDFLSTPGRATAGGLFYACANGWDMKNKNSELTVEEFGAFLEKAAAGREIEWKVPRRKYVIRADIINTLSELTK